MDEYEEEDVYFVPSYASLWSSKETLEENLELDETTFEEEEKMPENTPSIEEVTTAEWVNPVSPRVKGHRERAKEQRVSRFEKQESKRAPKVQIDQKIVLWLWVVGIVTAFVSSAFVSYNGITAVAEFVGLSQPWMGGLFFFFIELMYLLFLIAYLILASRVTQTGEKEKTFGAIVGMVSFGAIAVLANGFHTIDYWQYNFVEPRMWAGLVLSVSAPIAIISASKMASRVVFAEAVFL
jgi:hypothetical protein